MASRRQDVEVLGLEGYWQGDQQQKGPAGGDEVDSRKVNKAETPSRTEAPVRVKG